MDTQTLARNAVEVIPFKTQIGTHVRSEVARWGKVVKESGAKVE